MASTSVNLFSPSSIVMTLAQLLTAQGSGSLPSGRWIFISDICDQGGWLFCSSTATVDLEGFGLFLNCDWQNVGIYTDVVNQTRRMFNAKKNGHAGTLDPFATGVLPVAFGEATKLLAGLEGLDKVYDVEIFFGAHSETYDAEGPIHKTEMGERIAEVPPTRSQIEKIIEDHFLGERLQQPPIYSAIQIEGKRAYDLARKGKKVELKKRKVHFFDIQVKHFSWPILKCQVHCSSGTYIRSFAHDLGQILGCGGYVHELRRTRIGTHSIKDAAPLEGEGELTPFNFPSHLLKPEEFFSDWQQYNLTPKDYEFLAIGGFVENRPGFTKGPILAIYENRCVGVLELSHDGQLKFAKKFNIVEGD